VAGDPTAAVPDVDILDLSACGEMLLEVVLYCLWIKLSRISAIYNVQIGGTHVADMHPGFSDDSESWSSRSSRRRVNRGHGT
jgi:hypothetical protein